MFPFPRTRRRGYSGTGHGRQRAVESCRAPSVALPQSAAGRRHDFGERASPHGAERESRGLAELKSAGRRRAVRPDARRVPSALEAAATLCHGEFLLVSRVVSRWSPERSMSQRPRGPQRNADVQGSAKVRPTGLPKPTIPTSRVDRPAVPSTSCLFPTVRPQADGVSGAAAPRPYQVRGSSGVASTDRGSGAPPVQWGSGAT